MERMKRTLWRGKMMFHSDANVCIRIDDGKVDSKAEGVVASVGGTGR